MEGSADKIWGRSGLFKRGKANAQARLLTAGCARMNDADFGSLVEGRADAAIRRRRFILFSGFDESQITLLESLKARLHARVLDMFASAATHPPCG